MKRKGGYIKSALIIMLIGIAATVTGCGNTDKAGNNGETGTAALSGELTRGQFAGLLGEGFGYNDYAGESDIFTDVSSSNEYYAQIQSEAEWGVIDASGEFKPNDKATVGFALETAVKAVGLSDLDAIGATYDPSDLASFYTTNIAQIDAGDGSAVLTADVAEQIVDYAVAYRNNMELPQVTEMELMEGVKTAAPGIRLNADGKTGHISDGADYNAGDIVYFAESSQSTARFIKITSKNGNDFEFEDAPIDEVFSTLEISGTFDGEIVSITSASDGTKAGYAEDLYNEAKMYGLASEGEYEVIPLANGVNAELKGKDQALFSASFDKKYDKDGVTASAHGSFNIGIKNIKITAKYKHEAFRVLKPTEVGCDIKFDLEIASHLDGSVGVSIPLGEVVINVWGPLNLRLALVANLGADGSIDVTFTAKNSAYAGWQKGKGLVKEFSCDPSLDMEAEVTLTAEATALADLRVGAFSLQYSLVNAQITSGVVVHAKAEADILSDDPACIDVKLYVPLKWGVNQESCLLTDISSKLKYSQTIWDSENSPVKLHFHFEDGKRTPGDECTRGKEKKVEEPDDKDGEPWPDNNEFSFEMLDFDFIRLDNYVMYLNPGDSMDIGFLTIPDDLSPSQLTYTPEDGSVCSVSNGKVKGGQSGSTIVKISTPDGRFTATIAVVINEDYSIEGGFQPL